MPPLPGQIAKEIRDVGVADEMRDSFMPYALSVTTSRAIPDARDGLKPVQRRILHVMSRLGLRPDAPYRKSAGVVGEVMGKFHPHGDSAIYEAMVRLGQSFAMSVPLVDPKGNFGSLDDPPAAYRYTEARLNAAAMQMVDSIDEDTVEFAATFDGERTEPTCLPAALPALIVNGANGIAVGMATSLPPHNLAEAAEAIKLVLRSTPRRRPSAEDVLAVMPGPDFPSGGVIVSSADDIADAYRTGRGSIRVRAKVAVERATARRYRIVVTELPYMVGPERAAARIRELAAADKLDGVDGVEDHTDRHHGLRLVVQCKPGADPGAVLTQLWASTPLQDTFGINCNALDSDGAPRLMPLLEQCERWVAHRLEVVQRRTRHRLVKARDRAHIVEGLLKALDRIDEAVAVIRGAKDPAEARAVLQERLSLTETQAGHILDMQLRRLTALETGRLQREIADLQEQIARCERLLASEQRQRTLIAKELDSLVEAHSTPRRTLIDPDGTVSGVAAVSGEPGTQPAGDSSPGSPGGIGGIARVAVSASGLIGAVPAGAASNFKPGRHDTLAASVTVPADGRCGIVTSRGRLIVVDAAALPAVAGRSRGEPVRGVAGLARGETVIGAVPLDTPAAVVFSDGTAKRLDPAGLPAKTVEHQIAPSPGGSAARSGPGGEASPIAAFAAPDSAEIVIAASNGMALRFAASAVPVRGRKAGAVKAMKLAPGQHAVAAASVFGSGSVALLIDDASDGRGTQSIKVTDIADITLRGRGGAGMALAKLPAGHTARSGWIGADGALLVGTGTVPLPAATRRGGPPAALEQPADAAGERRR